MLYMPYGASSLLILARNDIMKKALVCVLLTFLLIGCNLVGCAKKSTSSTVTFSGESRNFSMSYYMYIKDNLHTKSNFTLKYKGTDIKNIKTVQYSVDGPTEGQNSSLTLDNKGTAHDEIQSVGGIPENNASIKVKLVFNNTKELFNLKESNN
jgi:hypothetical protein